MKYLGSKNRIAKEITPLITAGRTTETFYDLFCLEGNTHIYTPQGIVKIKDLQVGDFVYNEKGMPVKVINKIKRTTNGVELKIIGNISIKCTENHKFYSSGLEIMAEDLLGKVLDTGIFSYRKNHFIIMDDYVNFSENRFSMNGYINDDTVKLSHVSREIDRFINLSEDLMYLYGWVVAEGDKRAITLHIKELDTALNLLDIYEKTILKEKTNTKAIYYKNNTLSLIFPEYSIYKKVFFEAMGCGYGARNKNISFLFGLNENLVKKALLGMFRGDGSISKKTVKNKIYYRLNYKTSSKDLAYQLQFILMTYFNIKANIIHGMNKERVIDNRILQPSDYYNVDICGAEDIRKIDDSLIPKDYINIKNKKQLKVKKINIIESMEVFDISLEENSSHLYLLDGGIITHNCGGANIIDKISGNRVANDNNKYLIALLKQMQMGD